MDQWSRYLEIVYLLVFMDSPLKFKMADYIDYWVMENCSISCIIVH